MRVLTFGHGTADRAELTRLLTGAGAELLVDVRTAPGSRRNPDAGRDAMSDWLPEAGITYRWDKRLGGWRKAPPHSPDSALRNRSFAGYAAHMRSRTFADAIGDLLADAERQLPVVMCAESVWWRCHRSMIADYLVSIRHVDVRHLMHDGTLQQHVPSRRARVLDHGLVYDESAAS